MHNLYESFIVSLIDEHIRSELTFFSPVKKKDKIKKINKNKTFYRPTDPLFFWDIIGGFSRVFIALWASH